MPAVFVVHPANPSSDDSIGITVNGVGCVRDVTRTRVGTNFEFNVDLSSGCFATPPGFTFSWDLGRLAPGNYTATYGRSVDGGATTTEGTQSFVVSQGSLPLPVTIPSNTVSGLIVLTIVLAFIGNKSLQWTHYGR